MIIPVKYETHFGARVVVLVDDVACPTVDRVAIQIGEVEIIIIKVEIGILFAISKEFEVSVADASGVVILLE